MTVYSASPSPSISPSPSPELTGSVYVDKKDENNKDWPGITILLLQNNAVIRTGLTPVLFEDLPKGTYVVREVIPEGYEATGPTEYEFTVVDEHLFHNFTFSPFYIPDPEFLRNYQIVKGDTSINIYPATTRKRIPSWNIFGRPENPKTGLIGFNSQTNNLEVWDGKLWLILPMKKI